MQIALRIAKKTRCQTAKPATILRFTSDEALTIFGMGVIRCSFAVLHAICIPGKPSTLSAFFNAQYLSSLSYFSTLQVIMRLTVPCSHPPCPVQTSRPCEQRTRSMCFGTP